MKTLLFVLFIFSCTCFNIQAQSYKINKLNYDYKMYIPQPSDPNNPAVMGIASFLVPGLGQMLSGEVRRGIAFLGGSVACMTVAVTGAVTSHKEVLTPYGSGSIRTWETNPTGVAVMITGLVTMLAIDIWATVDAVKVAKVNNMYIQDLRGDLSIVKIEMLPFVDTKNYLGQTNTSAGLSLKVTF